MKLIIVFLLALPTFAHAFTVANLQTVLQNESVLKELKNSSIDEITNSSCGRKLGDYCLEVKLSDGRIFNVTGNSLFGTLNIIGR